MSPLPAATARCPLCGAAAYPWIAVPDPASGASVGMLSPVGSGEELERGARLFDRCEDCGAGIERGGEPIDLATELRAITASEEAGRLVLEAPNRASWQALVGGDGWAAVPDSPARLLLTRRALRLLAENEGLEPEPAGCPPWGRNQRWMWQTLLNGITLHPNFATRVLRGELRIAGSRGRFAYAADCVASALAAPLVALLSIPLEAIAALAGRGGRIVARAQRG